MGSLPSFSVTLPSSANVLQCYCAIELYAAGVAIVLQPGCSPEAQQLLQICKFCNL